MLIVYVHEDFMRMTFMVRMLGHRRYRLVMPRFMRTPRHARHDERADQHEKSKISEHGESDSVLATDPQSAPLSCQ